MDFEMGKKSGQIPAFGDWDNATDLPITQYFETARQAGLIRSNHPTTAQYHHHHHSRPYYDDHHQPYINNAAGGGGGCYHGCDLQKPPIRVVRVPNHRIKAENHGGVDNNRRTCPPQLKEQKQRIKEAYGYDDVGVDLRQHRQQQHHRTRRSSSHQLYDQNQKKMKQFPKHSAPITDDVVYQKPLPPSLSNNNNVKPVDEDLYKIPPELLIHHSKRKKMLGFFSKCLVPPCSA